MSQYKRLLHLYLKENSYEINDLLLKLSNKTIRCIVNDLQIEQNEVSDNTLYIFSDGNCRKNGKIGAKAGYSVFFSDNISSPYFKFNKTRLIISEPTNNKAELSGIKYIYDIMSQNKDLFKKNHNNIICTDSMYSINCIENWSNTWRKNGWKNSKGEIVKNKILIEEILELKDIISNDINVTFKHVFSHTREPINKDTLEWKLWYGNNIVDTNINKLFDTYEKNKDKKINVIDNKN